VIDDRKHQDDEIASNPIAVEQHIRAAAENAIVVRT